MNRFFLYEEYGAKYELMIRDVASTYRTMPQWEAYQKGLEALASSLNSLNRQDDISSSRKALTVGDLLVKVSHVPCRLDRFTNHVAYSTSLQVSSTVRRVVEANSGV
jgi:hypothetical protein